MTAILTACAWDDRTETAKDCGVTTPPILSDSGIGVLRVGATMEEIREACQVLRDTTLALGSEGMPERRVTVALDSLATTATISGGRVWRIEVTSRRFRTRDSLGVGSTMAELRTGAPRVAAGANGGYVLRADHCGLAFQMGGVLASADMRAAEIADTAHVDAVLVVGCEAHVTNAPSTASLVALGDSLFHGRVGLALCSTCHGQGAKGSNVAPNLTDDRWLHGDGSEVSLIDIITRGVATPKKYPGVMPPKGGGTLSEPQIRALAAYLGSFRS